MKRLSVIIFVLFSLMTPMLYGNETINDMIKELHVLRKENAELKRELSELRSKHERFSALEMQVKLQKDTIKKLKVDGVQLSLRILELEKKNLALLNKARKKFVQGDITYINGRPCKGVPNHQIELHNNISAFNLMLKGEDNDIRRHEIQSSKSKYASNFFKKSKRINNWVGVLNSINVQYNTVIVSIESSAFGSTLGWSLQVDIKKDRLTYNKLKEMHTGQLVKFSGIIIRGKSSGAILESLRIEPIKELTKKQLQKNP